MDSLRQQSSDEPEMQRLPGVIIDPSALPDERSLAPAPTEVEMRRTFRTRADVLDFLRAPMLSRTKDLLVPMEVEALLTLLREESDRRARLTRICRWIGLGLGLGWLAFVIPLHLLNEASLYFLYVPAGLLFVTALPSAKQRAAAQAIAQFDDLRAVGTLVEALEFPETSGETRQGLIRLLPRMKAGDAPLLSSTHYAALNKVLQGKDPQLILVVLKALEQVGGSASAADVQNLAEGRGEGAHLHEVRQAAQECLPYLYQNSKRRQAGSQLLRPVDSGQTSPDVLLRPAPSQASTEPPDELLRPGGET